MKILLLCEGKCEQTIMDILLDNNMLLLRDDLIERRGYQLDIYVMLTLFPH